MKNKIISLVLVTFLLSCSSDINVDTNVEINLPALQTNNITDISLYSVKAGGKLINSGDSEILEVGLIVGLSSLPTIDNNLNKFILTPDDLGNFDITITNIPANTTYYVRAYGVNSEGAGYGNEVQFTTPEENVYNASFSGLTLSTQQEVIEFGANNYTTINGSLYITGTVSDLSPLESIVIIHNSLEIKNTHYLQNLEGLNNLKIIGYDIASFLIIKNNSSLTSLSGLNNLEVTRGFFSIINNDNLLNMEGLNSYRAASLFDFRIDDCDGLQSLSGLENLQFIGDTFYLRNNPQLNDISSLSSLNTVQRIYISDNHSLQNINGLEAITSLGEILDGVSIINNDNLKNLDGLGNLETTSFITISYNDILTDISAFQNISALEYLSIISNNSLNNLNGLNNLISIEKGLSINHNSALGDFCALKNLFINDGYNGNVYFTGNLNNPTVTEIIENCN